MTKKLTNLSDGKPSKGKLEPVSCTTCGGTGKIGVAKCPMCLGVGEMTRSKQKRLNNG